MRNIQNLSENAQRFYQALQSLGGGAWESSVMHAMFPQPGYAQNAEARRAHWQYEANAYGHPTVERPVLMPEENNGVYVGEIFNPEPQFAGPKNSYAGLVSQGYQELRRAGLARERNSGFNDYYFYLVRK
jgi:hypothetical protein